MCRHNPDNITVRGVLPNTGPSTRSSPLIERAAPVTQRALRYLRRVHLRKIKEDIFFRLIKAGKSEADDDCSHYGQ